MHFCLIDCFDAGFFFLLHFVFDGAPIPARPNQHPPTLDEENLVGFQLHPARTFRKFFDGKKKPLETSGASVASIYVSAPERHFFIPDKQRAARRRSNV